MQKAEANFFTPRNSRCHRAAGLVAVIVIMGLVAPDGFLSSCECVTRNTWGYFPLASAVITSLLRL